MTREVTGGDLPGRPYFGRRSLFLCNVKGQLYRVIVSNSGVGESKGIINKHGYSITGGHIVVFV